MLTPLTPAEQRDIVAATLPRRGPLSKLCDLLLRRRRKPRIYLSGLVTARVMNPDGSVAVPWYTYPNGAVYVGLNKMQDVMFRNQAAHTTWYMGLIRNTGFTGENINDTMVTHAGWVEEVQYTAGVRPAWSPSAAALGVLSIASPISLTASATIDVKGVFATSDNAKSGTAGTLFATATEGTARNVLSGATYEFFYSVVLTPSN